MFDKLTKPIGYTADFRKGFDPTIYPAFRRYESGYSIFLILAIPNCLAKLTEIEEGEVTKIPYRAKYKDLITTYVKTLEREYKGLEGLENITSETLDYEGNNEVTVSVINKVSEVHNPTITLTYTEPYAAVLTRVHELFLKGIDDTVVGRLKHYNGLIDDRVLMPAFENEVFKFLYLITDNTGLKLEKAYYIFNAQPTTAHLSDLYNAERGTNEYKTLSYEFKCNVATGDVINEKAAEVLAGLTGYRYVINEDGTRELQKAGKTIYATDFEESMRLKTNRTDPNYMSLKALTGNKNGMGTLNNTNPLIPALKRQLGQDYEIVVETQYGSAGSSLDAYYANKTEYSGDTGDSKPTSENVDIDSPCLSAGDTVMVKRAAVGKDHSDISIKKATKSTTISNWTRGVIKHVLARTSAKQHAKDTGNNIVYGNEAVYPYQITLATGETYYFREIDIYKYDESSGDLINCRDTKKYKRGSVPCIDSPKFKVGDMVAIKAGTALYTAPYKKSNGSNDMNIYMASSEKMLLAKISYVMSSNVANTVAIDSKNPKVYSTYHVYGISVAGQQHTVYIKESDIAKNYGNNTGYSYFLKLPMNANPANICANIMSKEDIDDFFGFGCVWDEKKYRAKGWLW